MAFRPLVALVLCAGLLPVSWAGATTPTPSPVNRGFMGQQGFSGSAEAFLQEIDQFWSGIVTTAGVSYSPPRDVVLVDRIVQTACGVVGPTDRTAFYCPLDQSIYITEEMIVWASDPERGGDYGPLNVLAHEWAHHVQTVLNVPRPDGNAFELQADCMAGAWARQAQELGLLDKGDLTEAANVSAASGDDYGMPQDVEGAHGIDDDRLAAFMRGYDDGVGDCGLPLSIDSADETSGPVTAPKPDSIPQAPILPAAIAVLPGAPAVDHASCFFLVEEGDLDFAALLGRFAGVPDAASQLSALGWQDGAYRQFGCDGPPVGNAGWIDVSVHVFGDVASAQAAVAFFADARISGTSLGYDEAPGLGDAAAAISGPASNGWEYTLYASEGPVLVRVTGVAPVGTPDADVAAVMADTLGRVPADSGPAPAVADLSSEPAPGSGSGVDVLAMLPDHLAIPNGACFLPVEDWRFSAGEVLPWLEDTGAPAALVAGWNWQDGATRALRCATPLPGGAVQIDVTAHRFGDAASARAAEAWVLRGYPTRPWEARSCGTAGTVVVCVTGRGEDTPPDADVAAVLAQVLGEG